MASPPSAMRIISAPTIIRPEPEFTAPIPVFGMRIGPCRTPATATTAVFVAVGGTAVFVDVGGTGVCVGVFVGTIAVPAGVFVAVAVFVGVFVAVSVGVVVAVSVGVFVVVSVAVSVGGTGVLVGVAVFVAVLVGVSVGVLVGVGAGHVLKAIGPPKSLSVAVNDCDERVCGRKVRMQPLNPISDRLIPPSI